MKLAPRNEKIGRQIDATIASHELLYHSGVTRPVKFRIKQLKILKKLIIKYEADILWALEKDLGKNKFEAYSSEVGPVLQSINYTIRNLKAWEETKKVKTPFYMFNTKSYIQREPYGTALIIAPFNYPFNLLFEPLIGAIAGGNCVVLKPSEKTPHVKSITLKIIDEGFSPQYISYFEGDRDMLGALIQSKFDYMFFTGSVPVGKLVMEGASKNLVPLTLELGGKSPCIVDKTANIKKAARRIVFGKFFNAGQTCIAPDYVYVHSKVKDAFIAELQNVIEQFYGKEAFISKDYGRIVNEKTTERLVDILREDASKIVIGGKYNLKAKYIQPTVLCDVTWQDAVMQDEIFGPILPVLDYDDIDDVIDEIRTREKPLALYVFSKRRRFANKVLKQTSSGGACVNDTLQHFVNHNLPFGGVGHSGMGAYHGKRTYETFTHEKAVVKKKGGLIDIQSPPYSEFQYKMVRKVLR